MIPLWAWPLLAVGCLLLLAWWDSRRILRKANFSAVEAERKARESTAPLGNVTRRA